MSSIRDMSARSNALRSVSSQLSFFSGNPARCLVPVYRRYERPRQDAATTASGRYVHGCLVSGTLADLIAMNILYGQTWLFGERVFRQTGPEQPSTATDRHTTGLAPSVLGLVWL